MKRTSNETLHTLEDAQDLDHLVIDKRSVKRATSAKGRRRNRRYENRLLNAQLKTAWEADEEAEEPWELDDR